MQNAAIGNILFQIGLNVHASVRISQLLLASSTTQKHHYEFYIQFHHTHDQVAYSVLTLRDNTDHVMHISQGLLL